MKFTFWLESSATFYLDFFKALDLRSLSWIGRWSDFQPVRQLLAEAPPVPQQFSQQTDASSKELEGPRGIQDTSSTQEW